MRVIFWSAFHWCKSIILFFVTFTTQTSRWFHFWLLWLWFIIGMSLRLANLTAKPPWTDEFSTLVFSLGNSFLSVPLDQAITLDVLLQPLQPQPTANIQDVWTHLSHETNHPPLYFFLAHWWMQLFPTQGGLVSLWGARSLAVIFGAASIPAIYALSWLSFRSLLVSHLAAAMMAVSPYSIFLSQEARHYTLAILWVIASLACLVIAVLHIHKRTQLPISVALFWVVINAFGIATHYFFTLTICTEALVLFFLLGHQTQTTRKNFPPIPQKRLYAVAAGTFVTALVWLPVLLHNRYGSELTEWIKHTPWGFAWLKPIFQALAAWVTMICLLPVEAPQLVVVIVSGLVMLIFLIWATPILIRGFKFQLQQAETRSITQLFTGVVVGAIALFFVFTYFFGIDLTRGARYNFVYFPAVIVLVAASLAVIWNTPKEITENRRITGKQAVMVIWLVGFVSAVTVSCNLGYQKYYRPDLFVQLITQISQAPVVIATTQTTHVHIGEMMGIAREWKMQNVKFPPLLFLLAHQDENPHTSTNTVQNILKDFPRPLDLWLVNFQATAPEEVKNCVADTQSLPAINGYEYKIYHCQ